MNQQTSLKNFTGFSFKIIVVHTVTYFIFGLIMSNLFNYNELFGQEIIRNYMRPIDSAYVFAGPFLQPVRGLLFALALWPLRSIIFERKFAWMILWNLFVVFGILSTPAAAPCSIEGIIYSKLPLWYHLIGLPEILLQTLTLSVVAAWWIKRPVEKKKAREMSKGKKIFLRIMFAVTIACFGYVGYAIGSILSAKIVGVKIDLSSGSVNIKSQLMFVFAFVVNVLSVLLISSRQLLGKIPAWNIFFIFWFLDTIVLLIYQLIFTRMMPIHLALMIGFFPSLIIVLSYKLNYKNFELLNNSISNEEEKHSSG
jgi:hypothetical protein